MGQNAGLWMQALGSAGGAFGQIERGGYTRQVADYNASVAQMQAREALAQGKAARQRQGQRVSQTIGAQRAALAGQGVAVNQGSAADIQADTARLGELDALTIQNNAALEAWGYESKAAGMRMQGDMAQRAGYMNAAGTLLTGAGDTWLTGYKLGLWGDKPVKKNGKY